MQPEVPGTTCAVNVVLGVAPQYSILGPAVTSIIQPVVNGHEQSVIA